jgi:RHS repeat-associated protein
MGVSGAETRSFAYSGTGNRISETGTFNRSFTYDAFNRMSSASSNGSTTSYRVNGLDQRVLKSQLGGNTQTRFVYAGQNKLLAENTSNTSSGASVWTSYLWLGDTPVGLVRNNTLYWVHADHLGRPEVITDTSKQQVWRGVLDPYHRGAPVIDNVGGYNLGFPGQYWDSESSLWYNGFRDYDPTLGRYLQSDPIGLAGGVNTYAYVGGSPLTGIDPLGLINLNIDGVPISIHANPGPEATNYRPEHDPPHVHLGSNDGPRVDTQNFEPLSKKDAAKMTKEQIKMCGRLTDAQKDLIRARQAMVFKYGRILSIAAALPKVGVDSFTRACQTDIVFCVELIETVGPPASYRYER